MKTVTDYEFIFEGGIVMPVTLDPSTGDTIEWGDQIIFINLAPKPTIADPTKFIPREEVTIYRTKLLSTQKKSREILPIQPDQRDEWVKTVQELSKTVQ